MKGTESWIAAAGLLSRTKYVPKINRALAPEGSKQVSFLIFFLLSCLKIAVVLAIFLGAVAYTVLLERKLVGRIQNRWGPTRVGPFGMWQPMADGLKLFLKEDLLPTNVYRPLYILAPMIALACALISISVVPFGARITWHGVDMFEIANVNIGLLVILGVTSGGVYRDRARRLVLQQQIFPDGGPPLQCSGH